jgi:type IV secretory pathway TrbD component
MRTGARALNKPLLILGIDRRLAGLAFLVSVIVGANDGFVPKLSALALFLAMWAIGRRLTRIDPNIFQVMNHVRQRKVL